jgi:uroporphyrinogen-III decarboxylase
LKESKPLNSKERFINAVRCQPVDHPPLYLRLWSLGGKEDYFPFEWRDQVARASALLNLGLDDTLLLEPPLGYTENYNADLVPGLESSIYSESPDTTNPTVYPLLHKIYRTPAGPFSMTIKRTEDWPHGNDIKLFSDYNVPRFSEMPIKSAEDLPRLRWVLGDPSANQIEEFWQRARSLHLEADRLGVALDGGWSALGDSAVWLCGMEHVLYWQMDQPALLESLLDVLLEWELKRTDLLIRAGVDELVHMAWYEGTDFWTPKNYRRMIRPRLQQIIDLAHNAGIPFRYIITRGWKPLRRDFLEMCIDCLSGVDPVQDNVDLAEVKRELGGRLCLMGGMNSAITLIQGTEFQIRQAVDEAMRILAPGGGFILYPVCSIACEQPWENVQLVIDQWKANWQDNRMNKSFE